MAKKNLDTQSAVSLQKEISDLRARIDQKRIEHMIEMRKPQKASILWLQGANTGILLPEGLSRFAFRRPCPVECLPNEMHSIFHRGEAYSSGVSEKQKKTKSSALSAALPAL